MNNKINLAELSNIFQAKLNSRKASNTEWEEKHSDRIAAILQALPSGSGIDNGITFNERDSTPNKLRFDFGFHHMDDNGYYTGWTDHNLVITPSFSGFEMKLTGRDKNGIKEYLYQLFDEVFYVDGDYQIKKSAEFVRVNYPCNNGLTNISELQEAEKNLPEGYCPKCRQSFFTHNDDGSCIED